MGMPRPTETNPMSVDANNELQSFHQFVTEQLSAGQPPMSPEEALDVWRLHNPSPQQYADDVDAIREALADMKAGDTGTPLGVFRTEFRKRHNLNPHS
jgi:hypothetical protein